MKLGDFGAIHIHWGFMCFASRILGRLAGDCKVDPHTDGEKNDVNRSLVKLHRIAIMKSRE